MSFGSKSKKQKAIWQCTECSYESIQQLGKCPSCNSWNTLEEKVISKLPAKSSSSGVKTVTVKKLSEINPVSSKERIKTGFNEFDRVLGGGLEQGSFILLGGDPGIGKSTILLQTLSNLANNHQTLYISGEESEGQVKNRSQRLNINQEVLFLAETNLGNIIEKVNQEKPEIIIVDSIQAIHTPDHDRSFPGSPSQIRDCAAELMELAKLNNICIILVGHITKEGNVAGPKLLEHMVDVVLQFEGETHNQYRILRSVKNRFGPSGEIGVFEMSESGLSEIDNPSALFLSERGTEQSGTIVTASLQGSRVIFAEIQALVGYSNYAQPRRIVNGLDYNRVNQIAAILERRLGLQLSKQDIYTNVIGGIDLNEPGADLAIALAIYSCAKNLSIPKNLIAIGEIGLTGELRNTVQLELRVREAKRLGFEQIITSNTAKTLQEVIRLVFD